MQACHIYGLGERRARDSLAEEGIGIFDLQLKLAGIYGRNAGEIQIVDYDKGKRTIKYRIDESAPESVCLERISELD